MQVFDRDGNEVADFAISEKQQKLLEAGEEVTIIYTTPQLLLATLGAQSGSFALKKIGEHVIAMDADRVRAYAGLQQAVKQAREPQ